MIPSASIIARRKRVLSGVLAAAGFLIALATAQPAKADYAVLRSGQRLHITGWQTLGDTVRLDVPGGSVTIAADDLAAIEPEDVFGDSAKRESLTARGLKCRQFLEP